MAVRVVLLTLISLFASVSSFAQVDDFCTEFGVTPSLNSPWANIPFVFGRISYRSSTTAGKFPKITVVLIDPQQSQKRLRIERSGNYCFRRSANSGGTKIVDVGRVEVVRRSVSSFSPVHLREDFDIDATNRAKTPGPAAISAKFSYTTNDKTIDLYKEASDAEKEKDLKQATILLKEIVVIDPNEFIAWAKLRTLYLEQAPYESI